MATMLSPLDAAPAASASTAAEQKESAAAADALLPVYRRMPAPIVSGSGIELLDADGRAYVDFTSGIAVNALGYGDPGLAAALHAAADGLVHVSNLFRTAPGEELAAKLVARSFADQVFFCNSGAEANEGAFKIARKWARQVSGGSAAKHEIIALRGSFHGRLFATVAATDRPAYRMPFRPLVSGISIAERDLEELSALLDGERVAAVIVEPVQGEGGMRVLEPSFLRALRELTRERGILLMLDEIQCGLARTGRLFAYEHAEIEPDLLTLAKPIAGGLPMGAILMTSDVGAAMQPGDHGSTFGGGPFVASVANYVVDRLSDPALLSHVRTMGEFIGGRLRALAERTGTVRAIRGIGMMWGVDVHEPAANVVARAREAGLLLVTAGDHTVRLLPPLVASREELERGLDLLESVLGVTRT